MRYRKQLENTSDANHRPVRDDDSFPDDDEYGLHGESRRQYRGRESYEQQTRGGEAGRSGMWDHRFVPRDLGEPYRSNADEDQRGYQDIGRRQEFESRSRRRPEHPSRYQDDERRYGPGAQDHARSSRDRWESQGGNYADDYSRTDYGARNYGEREYRDPSEPGYDAPAYRGYSPRGMYHEESTPWSRDPSLRWSRGSEQRIDQGRYASTQYDTYAGRRRSGRGPKGYTRSDERIREDVCDRLSHQYDVDATDVEVSVSSGEVTLTGTVTDRDQKFRIEQIADGVGGVSEVHNQVRVRREAANPTGSQTTSPSSRNSTHQTRSS